MVLQHGRRAIGVVVVHALGGLRHDIRHREIYFR